MIKSTLFQQADVTFYTTEGKMNKHLYFGSGTSLVLLLHGAAFPGGRRDPAVQAGGKMLKLQAYGDYRMHFLIYYLELMTL